MKCIFLASLFIRSGIAGIPYGQHMLAYRSFSFFLCPWMGLVVDTGQVLEIKMGIDLRC